MLNDMSKPLVDPDKELMDGCASFLVIAVVGFSLVVVPFLLTLDVHRLGDLIQTCATGMVPCLILGAIAVRIRGLATGFGLVGSAMASSVFLFLRIQQISLAAQAGQSPPVEYPPVFQFLVPLGWILATVLVSVASLKNEADQKD